MKKLLITVLMLALCLQLVSCDLLESILGGVEDLNDAKDLAVYTTAEQIVNALASGRSEMALIFCAYMQEDEDLQGELEELFALCGNGTATMLTEEIEYEQDFSTKDSMLSELMFFAKDVVFELERTDEDGETEKTKFVMSFDIVTVYTADEKQIGMHRLAVTNPKTGEKVTVGSSSLLDEIRAE
ncbi:MAG: hypothetical protein IJW16_08885 [Clostridia bacterium]|nr:hypothetical protein [Clostridia bacterium]